VFVIRYFKSSSSTDISPLPFVGLKLPHIESYCYALKMSWIQKLLDPMNHSQWKLLLLDTIEKIGGDKVWLLKKVGIEKISTKLNPFWRDIFLNWSKILEGEEVNDATHNVSLGGFGKTERTCVRMGSAKVLITNFTNI
jgi:hypothetical protein